MDIKKLQSLVIDALEDIKAQDIKVYDTVHLTSLFDRIAIASGTSNRQTKALAASVRDKVKANGGNIVSIEGEDTGEWVLVDLGDMIVHIMQPAIRAYYRLEEIWGEKEVKFGAAKRTTTRTAARSSTASAETPKKPGRHLAASQATAEDKPEKPARKTAAKKVAAKKAVGKTVKVAPTKTLEAYKKTVAKKAPAKKAATKKPASKARAPAKPKAKPAE
jgi:ribosome-associated protein